MDHNGLPKNPYLRKAVMVNSTHDNGLQKELRYLESQRKGAMISLRVKERKFLERRIKLPRVFHPTPGKEMLAVRRMTGSRPNTADNGHGDSGVITDERRSFPGEKAQANLAQSSDDWSIFARENSPVSETAPEPLHSSGRCSAIEENSDASVLVNKKPLNTKETASRSSSIPSQLMETMKMKELCSLGAMKRAQSSLDVPLLGREQMCRSLPSSPMLRRRCDLSESPLRLGNSSRTAGLINNKQAAAGEGAITPPKEVSPRLTRNRAFTIDSATVSHRRQERAVYLPDILGPRNSLPDITPANKGHVRRFRSRTVSSGRYSHTHSLEMSTSNAGSESIPTREVWTEESTTKTSEEQTKATEERSDEETEVELTPEKIIDKVRYTRYLRSGRRESEDGDDNMPTHLMSRCVIIGHTKFPLYAPPDSSEDEDEQEMQDKQEKLEEPFKQELQED